MIKIAEQLCCTFTLGNVEDFIDANNLNFFRLYETAGNIRPILELSFILENEKLIKYINQGNILKVTFGINELDKDSIEFELYQDNTDKQFSLGYKVNLKASFYRPEFTSAVICNNYDMTSIDAFKQIANNYGFNLSTNIGKTNDKMNWSQNGETTWNYVKDLWLHSYINEKTFMCFGFDAYNMYFYDVRDLVTRGAKWYFTNKYVSSKNSNIVNFSGYNIDNQYGATNCLIGKNLINKTYNFDKGNFEDTNYNLKNFTAIDTNSINLNSSGCIDYNYSFINDDMHPYYEKAYNQNLRNNILFNSFSIYLTTGGQFKKFKLFDTVEFDILPSDERMAGIAFITGIVYEFQDNILNINLTLNKETASGIKGNLLTEAK